VNTPQAGPQMAGEAGTVHTTPITQPAQIVQNTGGGQRKTTPITSMEDLARAMGYTSPDEEERLRKASVANQRILAIGDALRHIGNIANTVNYAPVQQFTNPVVEEEQRYQKGKALRDAANLKYITYQQAKAAQDQKARQWEAEQKQKADQWNATFRYNAARDAARLKNAEDQWKAGLAYKVQNDEANRNQRQKQYDTQNALRKQSIGIQAANARNAENYRQFKMKNGGGSGNKSQNTIYSRRGYLTKAGANEADLKRIYDNMYEWGKNKKYRGKDGKLHPYIDEGGILAGISPDILGGKKISDASKREAVDKMIMEHDDAAVQLHHKHGFEWHDQTPNDKKDAYAKYVVNPNSADDDEEEDDYESYIID